MNGQVGLSSVISQSGRFVVSDLIRQATECYLSNLAAGVVAAPIKESPTSSVMTQEQIAVAVALDMSGKKRLSPAKRLQYNTDLYTSIRGMVFKFASRYALTCPDPAEDLAQDCMYRVLTQLHGFNPRLGKFTTWSWHVCRTTLNKKYRTGKKMRSVIVDCFHQDGDNDEGGNSLENMPERPVEGVQTHECSGIMAREIMDAVRDLATSHPSHKRLIFEIFGNPDSRQFVMPTTVSVSLAAKAVGMEYSRARVFYSQVVRPFFRQQFAGC